MSIPPSEEQPEQPQEPEAGDLRDDIVRQLALLFPPDRLQRIVERLGIGEAEEDVQYIVDLISATFTRGIEYGAIEVTAQQIQAGQQLTPQIEIAHVDLP